MTYENIPDELKQLNQWVLWRFEETDSGKPTKVPYALNHTLAATNDPSTWGSFDAVVAAVRGSNYYSGIGFVFTTSDPFCGIDLDALKNPDGSYKTGEEFAKLRDRQVAVFQKFDSYTEFSPSGEGLHIIIRAALPSGRKRSFIEMYSQGRFFTFTGNVYHNAPIAERQVLAETLFSQMVKDAPAYQYDGMQEETYSDEDIVKQALEATNGDKFNTLLTGDWQSIYPSQSEADLSFINIVAFYTQNRKQIRRIFRASPLGIRAKAKRDDYVNWMINKSFDRMLPPLDMDGLYNMVSEIRAQAETPVASTPTMQGEPTGQGEGTATSQPSPAIELAPAPVGITMPRGLMGEIAAFIYQHSSYPVPEIAIAGAIGFMSGICGRAWNVNGAGLNMYTLMLAQTGRGKEAMNAGVSKLVSTLATIGQGATTVPSIGHFVGPGEISSGQALVKALSKQPCFVSIIGEFGVKMSTLASERASSNDLLLKRTLLQLYSLSGKSGVFHGVAYSDKDKNVDAIRSPAFSILCESTPRTFYENLDESLIADGLLPRFLTISYDGPRVEYNEHGHLTQPSFQLQDKLADLVVQAHALNGTGIPAEVTFDAEAYAMHMDFNRYCTAKINASQDHVSVELWNRAHLKLMKLAALIAVGANPAKPVITAQDITWAYKLIESDITRLTAKFATGEVGKDQDISHSKQQKDMYRVMIDFINRPLDEISKYGVTKDAHTLGLISYSYVSRRLASMASYRKDKQGATPAIKRTIEELVKMGVIGQVSPKSVTGVLKSEGLYYTVVNATWI